MARSWGFLALALCSYVTTFAPPTQQITRYSTLAANSARRRTTLSFPPSRRGRILLSTTVAAEVVNATAPAEASAEAPAPPSRRETHYDALGLRRDATDAQIRSSYRTMSKTCHPDVDPSEASRAKFDAINEAYATLKTAKTRDAYDYELRKEDLAESAEQWVDDALVPFVRDTAAPTLGAVGSVMGAAFGAALKTARANDVSPASAVAAAVGFGVGGPVGAAAGFAASRAAEGENRGARTAVPAARTAAPAARTAAPTSNTTATPGIAARRAAELAAERSGTAQTAAPAARTSEPSTASARAATPMTAPARSSATTSTTAPVRSSATTPTPPARTSATPTTPAAAPSKPSPKPSASNEAARLPERWSWSGPVVRERWSRTEAGGIVSAAPKRTTVRAVADGIAAAMGTRTAPSKPSAPKPSAVDEAAATARSASDETAAAPRRRSVTPGIAARRAASFRGAAGFVSPGDVAAASGAAAPPPKPARTATPSKPAVTPGIAARRAAELAAERSEKAPVDREAAADVAKLTRSDLRRILLRRGMDASGPRSELAKRVRKLDLSE